MVLFIGLERQLLHLDMRSKGWPNTATLPLNYVLECPSVSVSVPFCLCLCPLPIITIILKLTLHFKVRVHPILLLLFKDCQDTEGDVLQLSTLLD